MHAALCSVLMTEEEMGEQTRESLKKLAVADWVLDSKGAGYLDYKKFVMCFFELADRYTDGTSPQRLRFFFVPSSSDTGRTLCFHVVTRVGVAVVGLDRCGRERVHRVPRCGPRGLAGGTEEETAEDASPQCQADGKRAGKTRR